MTPATLRFGPAIWRATLDVMGPYRIGKLEGGCLWYGLHEGGYGQATLVGVPRQQNRALNFEISADALADLNMLVPDGLVVIAQVHSHPGSNTTHSRWDDKMMVSRKVFSLVLPRYAALPCDLPSVGVHAHDGRRWVKLPRADGLRRLIMDPEYNETTCPLVVDAR